MSVVITLWSCCTRRTSGASATRDSSLTKGTPNSGAAGRSSLTCGYEETAADYCITVKELGWMFYKLSSLVEKKNGRRSLRQSRVSESQRAVMVTWFKIHPMTHRPEFTADFWRCLASFMIFFLSRQLVTCRWLEMESCSICSVAPETSTVNGSFHQIQIPKIGLFTGRAKNVIPYGKKWHSVSLELLDFFH